MPQPDRALSSRERIIVAATEMITEDASTSLSVRAVASRAGVSMGSLRHHFPSQRQLRETVTVHLLSLIAPERPVDDAALPVRERLIGRLHGVLDLAPPGDPSRLAWRTVHENYIAAEPDERARASYAGLGAEMHRRLQSWFTEMRATGDLPEGDDALRIDFLLTIVNGLSIERALPLAPDHGPREGRVLAAAVDAALAMD